MKYLIIALTVGFSLISTTSFSQNYLSSAVGNAPAPSTPFSNNDKIPMVQPGGPHGFLLKGLSIPIPMEAGGTGMSSGIATSANQDTTNITLGSPNDPACLTDIGTCSSEALWKRIAQRLTTIITTLGSPLQDGGNVTIDTSALATSSKQDTTNTTLGAPGDTACATDNGTCSSEALWKRIAQRLTSIITTLGSPLQAGGSVTTSNWPTTVDTNSGNKSASTPRMVIATDQPNLTTPLNVQRMASTTGGASTYFVQPAASDNHAVIKNGAGTVYDVQVFNNSATINYLRLYDAGTGFNGCNSATNLVTQIQIPASTTVGGATPTFPVGKAFATGISICITSGYATTDTANATASAMSVSVGYK